VTGTLRIETVRTLRALFPPMYVNIWSVLNYSQFYLGKSLSRKLQAHAHWSPNEFQVLRLRLAETTNRLGDC
jgi:hypothetical protein